jgi:hypothetical protein
MIDTTPDLAERVEDSIARVFRDAFPGILIATSSKPVDRVGTSIGIKAESGAEEPIGTNMFPVAIDIETRNLETQHRELMREMIGNADAAQQTVSAYSAKSFTMPRGQAVEMIGAPRTVENENDRIVTYSLVATIQPI